MRVDLKWHDQRITFLNLKPDKDDNQLSKSEIDQIWTPQLLFDKSNEIGFIKAGYDNEGDLSQFSGLGIVRINRDGMGKNNALEELDENYEYSGKENLITMTNYMTVRLGCNFDLSMYPFDTQGCPIKLIKPSAYDNAFVLQWEEPPKIESKIYLTQYTVDDELDYDNTNLTHDEIEVYIKLRRKLSHHVFHTYIPTSCLAMIAGFTLFIDVSHFEATIMVALTSMLVIYTLHQSISATLPLTSYMKMIDVWLFAGLIIPFVIIGKNYALKKYDQFTLNNSCFFPI